MRITILTDNYPSIKSPNPRAFVHARARLYAALGHDVHILSSRQTGVPKQEVFEGIQVIRPISLQEAQLLVEAFLPDVIAIHSPYRGTFSTALAADLRNDYPLVVWIHGYEAMYTAFFGYHGGINCLLSIFNDWLKLHYLRRFLAKSESVVYVSNWMKCIGERSIRYTHPRSWVIANPIDTEAFAPGVESHLREPLRGLALRGLGPKYGLDIAIRAYAELQATDLTIIGTGCLEHELKSLITVTRSSTALLVRSFPYYQVPGILREYDYFIAPSRIEAQGLAMCEAMSCGLPVVATQVGGIPEFVRDDIDGYLVPPEDPKALRTAVLKLIEDPSRCRQMGKNARQHMLEVCEGKEIAARELQVLQEACLGC